MSDEAHSRGDDLLSYLREFSKLRADRSQKAGEGPEAAYPAGSRLAKAYEVALDIRKFEIELSWKRAGYFWLMLAAFATALGLIVMSNNPKL